MDSFRNSISSLARIMYYLAGISIVAMMLLTCADVLLRFAVTVYRAYQWDLLEPFKPIPGTFELVGYMGAVAVSFAMAHTSIEKGHVAVSLIVQLFPQRIQALIGTVTCTFGFILFALLSWQSIVYGNDLRASGEVSLTLQLPFYPFVYGIAFASAAVCLVLILEFLTNTEKALAK